MQLFIAFKTEDDFNYLRDDINNIGEKLDILSSKYYLPFHISLKNNFNIQDDKYDDVIKTLERYVLNLKPKRIRIKGIEISENIIWIRMHNYLYLKKIHRDLDRILKHKFGIIKHKFDLNYKFHVTLFMDDNLSKINEAYNLIRNTNLPSSIVLNKLFIGVSNDGSIGSYRVYKEYNLKK